MFLSHIDASLFLSKKKKKKMSHLRGTRVLEAVCQEREMKTKYMFLIMSQLSIL